MPDRPQWLTSEQAVERLAVRRQTLYAYVSRGLISVRPDESDPRRSVYAASDVEALATRKGKGRGRADIARRTIAWGEPVLESAISTVQGGRLVYRGHDAVELAQHATLEEIASLLWNTAQPHASGCERRGEGETALARGLAYLARRAAADTPSLERAPEELTREAWEILDGTAGAMIGAGYEGPIHECLGTTWHLAPDTTDLVRIALVLLADHELSASAFAARVAASTGAPLAAAALAGMASFIGPLHGHAVNRALALLDRAVLAGPDDIVAGALERGEALAGFGHPLYPHGDPRATALIARLALHPKPARFLAAVDSQIGEQPNVDMAIAVMTRELGLNDEAAFTLFALGRCVGWLAHALEQRRTGQLIRPRAQYTGA